MGNTESSQNHQDQVSNAIVSELLERRWSVISFDKREAASLTYAEALDALERLESSKIAGLCIVTDEVGAKVKAS